jgi:hypothetical protein
LMEKIEHKMKKIKYYREKYYNNPWKLIFMNHLIIKNRENIKCCYMAFVNQDISTNKDLTDDYPLNSMFYFFIINDGIVISGKCYLKLLFIIF